MLLQYPGYVEQRDGVASQGEEALSLSSWMGHRAEMDVGYVADVHRAEKEAWAGGNRSVEQTLHDENRRRVVGAQDRPEDAYRIYGRELELATFARDEVLCGTFGNDLGLGIGCDAGAREIGLVGLCERGGPMLVTVADRGEGRSHDDAFDSGITGRAQDAEGSFTGRNDELIFMLGGRVEEKGSYVKDIAAASDDLLLTIIRTKVGGDESEGRRARRAYGFECGADFRFASERTVVSTL